VHMAPSFCRQDKAPAEDSRVKVPMEARAGCSELLSANRRDNSLTSPSVQGRLSGPVHLTIGFAPGDVPPAPAVAFAAWAGDSDAPCSYVDDGHLSLCSASVLSGCASPSTRCTFPVPSQ